MKTFEQDGLFYTNSEWFVARITAVGDRTDTESNYPCSWGIYNFTDDMAAVNLDNQNPIYGDYAQNYNTAYPINELQPVVGDIVLMRYRGSRNEIENVFEFVQVSSYISLNMTALQCSGGLLSATYSDGCTFQ